MRQVRIGAGAGYSGDRIEPAIELAEHGRLDYLVFECLAERTIGLAQQARRVDARLGYDPLLAARIRAVLPACRESGTVIVSNMGAANPMAAGELICAVARELGISGLKVAVVTGDDVATTVTEGAYRVLEDGREVATLGRALVSANAYIGAEPIVTALAGGADVVVTGRAADPSLFLGPLAHEFGWAFDDWDRLGQATLIGHVLECAGQVTGGYFADPGFKAVPGLAKLGFPLAEVSEDGSAIITKVMGSGGCVTTGTCKEQILYEIHDPSRYFTPDVVADFSQVRVEEVGPDRIHISGAGGRERPATLKVSLGVAEGFVGEGQISYAGSGARSRAELAGRIVGERFALTGLRAEELRFDLIGVDALHGPGLPTGAERSEPYEVRLRVAGRTLSAEEALLIGNEVETLYTNGPAGGGGVTKQVREVLGVLSTLIPREHVRPSVQFLES